MKLFAISTLLICLCKAERKAINVRFTALGNVLDDAKYDKGCQEIDDNLDEVVKDFRTGITKSNITGEAALNIGAMEEVVDKLTVAWSNMKETHRKTCQADWLEENLDLKIKALKDENEEFFWAFKEFVEASDALLFVKNVKIIGDSVTIKIGEKSVKIGDNSISIAFCKDCSFASGSRITITDNYEDKNVNDIIEEACENTLEDDEDDKHENDPDFTVPNSGINFEQTLILGTRSDLYKSLEKATEIEECLIIVNSANQVEVLLKIAKNTLIL